MERNFFFSRDSEAAFGSERATRGGSFWTRIRLGKGVAGSGVRGSRSAGAKGRPGGWLGRESDGEKLWRRQVFGARMGARKERKVFCFIQRGQVFGARMSETMSETNGKKLLFF